MRHQGGILKIACLILSVLCMTTLSAQEFENNVMLIKLKPKSMSLYDKQELPKAIKDLNIVTMTKIQVPNSGLSVQEQGGDVLKVTLQPGQDIEKLAAAMSKEDGIEYAEPSYKVTIMNTPNDPGYADQSYLNKSSLPLLWSMESHMQVVVAVVDTGVDYTHEDLIDAIEQNDGEIPNNGIDDDHNGYVDDRFGYNFYQASEGKGSADPMDEQGHGTHLSGIIAAKANNRVGISGINPEAKILAVRFLDKEGAGSQVDAALAIRYAVDCGAKIINCSWGYYKLNTILDEAIYYAVSKGVIVVAAVGNTNTPIVEYPSGCQGVIGVGALTLNNAKASYSSYGSQVDFMAYGSSIFSTLPSNQYGIKSGSSQAAAVMSGVISSIMGANPLLKSDDIYEILKNCSVNNLKKDSKLGYGLVDSQKVLALMENIQTENGGKYVPISTTDFSEGLSIKNMMNYPNPVKAATTFGFDSNTSGADVKINIYNVSGNKVDELSSTSSSGYNKVNWDPKDLDNGTYIYVATIRGEGETKTIKGKLAILK